jgi:hypothetical protein
MDFVAVQQKLTPERWMIVGCPIGMTEAPNASFTAAWLRMSSIGMTSHGH